MATPNSTDDISRITQTSRNGGLHQWARTRAGARSKRRGSNTVLEHGFARLVDEAGMAKAG
jgi:hypothetical protein